MKGLNKIKKCWKQLMLVLAMFLSISASTLTQANALNAALTWDRKSVIQAGLETGLQKCAI